MRTYLILPETRLHAGDLRRREYVSIFISFHATILRSRAVTASQTRKLKISNAHISGTGRLINFVFDSRVWLLGTADQIDLLPVGPNPRSGCPPSWKISNDHISGMGYPIHFHELDSSSGGTEENIMCWLLSTASELHRLPACIYCISFQPSVVAFR